MGGGKTQSSVYHDPDLKKHIVHRVYDAEPALEMAHMVRSEIGPWSGQRNLRRFCAIPMDDAMRMGMEATEESRRTGENSGDILSRKVRAFVKENPRFKT